MLQARSMTMNFLTVSILFICANCTCNTFGDEGSSIAELKSQDPTVIIENRQSRGRIKGKLVSLTSKGVLMQIGNNPARNFSWEEYSLVFAEGLTNAHELLEHAKELTAEITHSIVDLKFEEGEFKAFEEIAAERAKALEVIDRVKTQNIEKFPGIDEMPAFSTTDRDAIGEVSTFKEVILTDYQLSDLREKYFESKTLHDKVSLLRKRLTTFKNLVSKKRFPEAQVELDRQLNQISELEFPPEHSDIEASLKKLHSSFNAILLAQDSVFSTPLHELQELQMRWNAATESFRLGMNTPAGGSQLIKVFQEQLKISQIKVSEIEQLIGETKSIASLAKEANVLVSYDSIKNENPELHKVQLEKTRLAAVTERKKWETLPQSKTGEYALNELQKIDEKIDIAERSMQFVDFQKQGNELILSLAKVRETVEARELAVSLNGLKNEIESLLKTPQVSNSQKQKLRKVLNSFEEGRQRSLSTELVLHKRDLSQLQRTLEQILKKKEIDIASASQKISASQASLPRALKDVYEIGKLSPSLIVSVNKVADELKGISSSLQKASEIMDLRSSIQEKSDAITTSQDLNQLEKEAQDIFDELAKIDLSENKTLDELYQWTQSEIRELQSSIRSIRPVRSFQKESIELERSLTGLVNQFPNQPLQVARIAAFSSSKEFSKLDKWYKEFPQLQVAENKSRLLNLQSRQQSFESQIEQRISEVRMKNGWIKLSEQANTLLPPSQFNKKLKVISRLDEAMENNSSHFKDSSVLGSKFGDEFLSQMLLRKAQKLESKNEFKKAHLHYQELSNEIEGTFSHRAALNGASRTEEEINLLLYDSLSQRRMTLSVIVGVTSLLLIGMVLYTQSKSVRLFRAKRHFEKAKNEAAQGHHQKAQKYYQLGTRLVSQYSYDDQAVQKILLLLDQDLKKESAKRCSSSSKITPKNLKNTQSMWVCGSLGTSEAAVRFVIDQLASEKLVLKKSERKKQIRWLTQQFKEISVYDQGENNWRLRELKRLVKLFPKVTDFRILLVKMEMQNKNFSEAYRTVSPLLNFKSQSHQRINLDVVQLAVDSLVGSKNWEQLERLVENFNKTSKRPIAAKILGLAVIGSEMDHGNKKSTSPNRLHENLNSLLMEPPSPQSDG